MNRFQGQGKNSVDWNRCFACGSPRFNFIATRSPQHRPKGPVFWGQLLGSVGYGSKAKKNEKKGIKKIDCKCSHPPVPLSLNLGVCGWLMSGGVFLYDLCFASSDSQVSPHFISSCSCLLFTPACSSPWYSWNRLCVVSLPHFTPLIISSCLTTFLVPQTRNSSLYVCKASWSLNFSNHCVSGAESSLHSSFS